MGIRGTWGTSMKCCTVGVFQAYRSGSVSIRGLAIAGDGAAPHGLRYRTRSFGSAEGK